MPDNDLSYLTGPQKAAITVLTMGEERASKMFAKLDDDEIRVRIAELVGPGKQ